MSIDYTASILALGLFGAIVVWRGFHIGHMLGRPLNFRSLLLYNYALTSLVSGMVHLSAIPGVSRGYFDVLLYPASHATAVVGSIVGGIALIVATSVRPTELRGKPDWYDGTLDRWSRFLLPMAGIAIFPLAVGASLQLSQYVSEEGLTRVISLSDGLARLSFFSAWLAWGVSFLMIWLAWGWLRSHPYVLLVLLSASLVLIAISLRWNGGRSVLLVMTLPLVLTLWPKLRSARRLLLPAAVTFAFLYIASLSEARLSSSIASSPATWLDWEWGRFSMLGFAAQYADEHGFLWGETILAGLSNTVLGIVRLAGIYIPNPELRTAADLSGFEILNSSDIYVVPGFSAEMFINFGYLGIVVGYALLGFIVSVVDRRFASTESPVVAFSLAYLGTLLVFRSLPSASDSVLNYLLYTGFPVMLLWLVAAAAEARVRRARAAEESALVRPGPRTPPRRGHTTSTERSDAPSRTP